MILCVFKMKENRQIKTQKIVLKKEANKKKKTFEQISCIYNNNDL